MSRKRTPFLGKSGIVRIDFLALSAKDRAIASKCGLELNRNMRYYALVSKLDSLFRGKNI